MIKHTLLFSTLVLCATGIKAQDVSLGLNFTPPEQLQGIPLASTPFSGEELPGSVDLSSKMPPAGNQGKQNSCVGWAVAYACKSFQEKLEENNSYTQNGQLNTKAVFSPSFIYNQINNGVDGGSLFVDALNVLSHQGAVKWSDMPYVEGDYTTRPNDTQKTAAKRYRIDFWRRVNYADSKEVKAQLNAGYPVIFGANVDRAFISDGKAANGIDFIWKAYKGDPLGGHAMLVVGYDDDKNAYKVLNSWGKEWGNNGYCWIDYDQFARSVREAFVAKDAINGDSPSNAEVVVANTTGDRSTARLKIGNVTHNIQDYNFGLVMRFDGEVDIPKGAGTQAQVVIRFYLNDGNNGKGDPIGSTSFYFMMPDGTAACGTPKTQVEGGKGIPWFAQMPYGFMDVNWGEYDVWGNYVYATTYLVAEPILYIDDFAVETGELIPFYVNL